MIVCCALRMRVVKLLMIWLEKKRKKKKIEKFEMNLYLMLT